MTTTTEKAPDAGRTAMPGADQNPTIKKETGMSQNTDTVSETVETAPAKQHTKAFDRAAPTEEQREWARANTKPLEVRWISKVGKRDPDYFEDGNRFRLAGILTIRPCKDGVTRFVANMPEESVHEDFLYIEHIIQHARAGDMSGWGRHTFKDGGEGWWFDYPLYRAKETDRLTPAQVFELDAWGVACTEPRCREAWHGEPGENHTIDRLYQKLGRYFDYEVEICKDSLDPDGKWYLNLWPGTEMSEATPEMIATFVNDLNWMSIECETANAKEADK